MATEKRKNKKDTLQKKEMPVETHGYSKKVKTSESSGEKALQSELFNNKVSADKSVVSSEPAVIDKQGFNLNAPVYYQINMENIYSIFSSGLIYPRTYLNYTGFTDVQTINSNGLLLSNGFIGAYDVNSVLLEIVLEENEIKALDIDNNIAFLVKPIPVSRIISIRVVDPKVKQEIIITSLSGDGGIIPENLFKVIDQQPPVADTVPIFKVQSEGLGDKIHIFDRILGTFAFLANYGILMADRLDVLKTRPEHFLIAAKTINDSVDSEMSNERVANFYKILFGMNTEDQPSLQWLVKRIAEGKNFSDDDLEKFVDVAVQNPKADEFLNEARPLIKALTRSLERKNAIRAIPKLKHSDKFYLYILAVLRQYGSLMSEDRSISRADLPGFVSLGYGEYVFACLGYFYGYSALRNFDDRIKINDPFFDLALRKTKRLPLKFKLDSSIDLLIIESVYQYVFNGGTHSTLKIDDRYTHIERQPSIATNVPSKNYSLIARPFLGDFVFELEKKSDLDQLEKLIEKYENFPGMSEIGLFCNRNNIPYHCPNNKEILEGKWPKEYFVYFKKEDLLVAIKAGKIEPVDVILNVNKSINLKEL